MAHSAFEKGNLPWVSQEAWFPQIQRRAKLRQNPHTLQHLKASDFRGETQAQLAGSHETGAGTPEANSEQPGVGLKPSEGLVMPPTCEASVEIMTGVYQGFLLQNLEALRPCYQCIRSNLHNYSYNVLFKLCLL